MLKYTQMNFINQQKSIPLGENDTFRNKVYQVRFSFNQIWDALSPYIL